MSYMSFCNVLVLIKCFGYYYQKNVIRELTESFDLHLQRDFSGDPVCNILICKSANQNKCFIRIFLA